MIPTVSIASSCVNSTDAEIFSLIDTLRTAGTSIVIDGNDSDWALFPSYPDTVDDLPANPG